MRYVCSNTDYIYGKYLSLGLIIKIILEFYNYVLQNSFIHQWLYSPLLDPGRFFCFIIRYTVDMPPWTGDQPVASPLPTQDNTDTV
jgi:hypothetical protein